MRPIAAACGVLSAARLHMGYPIIERHLAHARGCDAMDLALAWAEQWPDMPSNRRKSHLCMLTPAAAALLRLLRAQMDGPPFWAQHGAEQACDGAHAVGVAHEGCEINQAPWHN